VTTSLEKEGSAPGAPSPGSCPLEGGQASAYTAKCWPLYTQLGEETENRFWTFLDAFVTFWTLGKRGGEGGMFQKHGVM